jgi:hypothetical protein
MKKIAILVIAATNQSVYIHYIKTYWIELIKHTNEVKPNIDVFLLLENGTVTDIFSDVLDNVIEDKYSDLDQLCDPQFQSLIIPGILSKTIYALELLQDEYDVFFRTNLSSLIKISALEDYVQSKKMIGYSGGMGWPDALRENILFYNMIGPEKSIKTIFELDAFKGDTFISGAGYFLSTQEARSLVKRKQSIRFDLPDDVAVGLMFAEHEMLGNFSAIIRANMPLNEIMHTIRTSDAVHIRLQHLPASIAEEIWHELENEPVWK